MIRLYIIGICILLIAIVANMAVTKLGLSTWYDFGTQLSKSGFSAFKEVGIISCLWLFILYPLTLSMGYVVGDKLYGVF